MYCHLFLWFTVYVNEDTIYTEYFVKRLFRADQLLRHLLPRVARLGNKVGLRLIGSVKTGSVYDGTCVMSADEVDILIMFDTYQVNSTQKLV